MKKETIYPQVIIENYEEKVEGKTTFIMKFYTQVRVLREGKYYLCAVRQQREDRKYFDSIDIMEFVNDFHRLVYHTFICVNIKAIENSPIGLDINQEPEIDRLCQRKVAN